MAARTASSISPMDQGISPSSHPAQAPERDRRVASAGDTCDACDAIVATDQLLMEGITLDLGRKPLQLHVRCFQMWDHESRAT
jgi:hypothetical protein